MALDLDQTTLNYVRHRTAGIVKNIRGCSKRLKEGETDICGIPLVDIINRDILKLTDFLNEIKE